MTAPLAILFTSPLAAISTLVGAASIPIIIHLLNRRRYRIVDWAAMRFLLAAQKQNVRRLKLEQWLLLAVRTLLMILLVVAMASVMPWAEALWQRFLPGGAVAGPSVSGRTHKVILIDGSLSMTARADGAAAGTCFDRARLMAADLVRKSPAGDGFSVVLVASSPQAIVPGPAEDSGKVVRAVEELRCPHGAADLNGALQLVEELVRKAPSGKYAQREVYVVSDLQKSMWAPTTAAAGANPEARPADALWKESWERLQGQSQLFVLDVGGKSAENLAVTNLTLTDPLAVSGTRTTIKASVLNSGATERANVRVELSVGGGPTGIGPEARLGVVEQQIISVPAGTAVDVPFLYEFRAPGEYVFQARVEADALEADDVRSLTVTVRDTLPVLLVNGKPAADRREQAASWLSDALDPFPEGTRNPLYPARPKTVGESEFADPGAGDLSAYDCVFLCDVPRLSEREVSRLETHLQRGGGLVICLGPGVDLEAYNRVLYRDGQGLLPAKLVGLTRAPEDGFFTLRADDEHFQRPPLAAFAADNDRAALLGSRFRQYFRVEIAPGSAARKLLSFWPAFKTDTGILRESRPTGGDPLLVEWPRHRGRVVLITSTVNTDWSSWPISPSFAPLAQELLRFALLQPPRKTAAVGEAIEELLPSSQLATDVGVLTPDGRTETVGLKAEPNATRFRFAGTDQSGLYRAKFGGARGDVFFAVTPPSGGAESDLRRATADDIRRQITEDVQVVTDLGSIRHAPKRLAQNDESTPDAPPTYQAAVGPGVARYGLLLMFILLVLEVILAWRFGSARRGRSAALDRPPDTMYRRWADRALAVLAGLPLVACAVGGFVLAHAAWTGDLLGFLSPELRRPIEAAFGVPEPAPGEGTRWRLEFLPYLTSDPETDRWLAGTLGIGVAVLAIAVYVRELPRTLRNLWAFLPLVALRTALAVITLAVFLPQVKLLFEREGWPDLVIMIDDSASMSTADDYQDPQVQAKAEELGRLVGPSITKPQRLQLAQTILTRNDATWIDTLLTRRQTKLHVFHCSTRAERSVEITDAGGRNAGADAVRALKPTGPSSMLGTAVRTVLQEFRGASLAGIILFTDGVATEGDELIPAAQEAARQGVPIYPVGIGDAQEPRDLVLSDLLCEDSVHVHDRLVFEARLTARGALSADSVPVTLYEKLGDQFKELTKTTVIVDKSGKPVKVRVAHTPIQPGERVYILDVPGQADETDLGNNRLQRQVFVADFKKTRVLYVEGYPRYEYRFIKTLLERESAATRANKTVELNVILADADPDYIRQDRSAVPDLPVSREELFERYDLVILGDINPRHSKLGEKQLQWLADFVKERGGGLLFIAGSRYNPRAYRDTPLADVLPVEIPPGDFGDAGDDREFTRGFRLHLTPAGQIHPLFRFVPDETENQALWERLTPLYWTAEVTKPKPAAEVLAFKPVEQGALTGEPLIVQQFVGAGRVMFFGFDESWRWRLREDEVRFNQFWIQAIRYLARSRLGRTDLRLDKQVPYRKGDPIRVTVRFPDDVPPPGPEVAVKVVAEYTPTGGDVEVQTLQLAKVEGSRATYEALLARTGEGTYKLWLASPASPGTKPNATAKVLPPAGELDRLRMNQPDLERVAVITKGRFYSLADAEKLPEELPPLPRVTLNQPRPPYLLWNHPSLFALALALICGEWLLRKRHQLL